MNKLLDGLQILDFSSRLPGPLATSILQEFGASVTKVELKEDTFADKETEEKLFNTWYKNINANKTVLKELQTSSTDVLLVPNPKVLNRVRDKVKFKIAVIVQSNRAATPMHDINALAKSRAFQMMGNQALPFAPVMGTLFANQIALTITSALYKYEKMQEAQILTCYFEDTAGLSVDKLAPDEKTLKSLHSGSFPCNACYELKDGKKLALATIEEHLWDNLLKVLEIPLQGHDRFDTSSTVFNILQSYFKSKTSEEISKKLEGNDICLTLID